MATATALKPSKQLPPPNSDFYQFADLLTAEERAIVRKVRTFMESGIEGYGCAGGSQLLAGLVVMEMARVDCSIATFFGVQNGLAMASIALGGSEEQKQKWLPPMARY